MKNDKTRKSKFLSLVLRHKPDAAGVTLDDNGWCSVDDLLRGAGRAGIKISPDELADIVATNEKQRFCLSDDGSKIRANQGHSLKVDLGFQKADPPEILYHGTTTRVQDLIMREGLRKMKRHHVHLSADQETAKRVGMRHGKIAVLEVHSGAMKRDGFEFFQSENGVWLVDSVPTKYLKTATI
jgi:putative RNA 2'-phosphotransferase